MALGRWAAARTWAEFQKLLVEWGVANDEFEKKAPVSEHNTDRTKVVTVFHLLPVEAAKQHMYLQELGTLAEFTVQATTLAEKSLALDGVRGDRARHVGEGEEDV